MDAEAILRRVNEALAAGDKVTLDTIRGFTSEEEKLAANGGPGRNEMTVTIVSKFDSESAAKQIRAILNGHGRGLGA